MIRAANWLERMRFEEDDAKAEKQFVRFEKELFFGFYLVRKLFDTLKISDATKQCVIFVQCFPIVEMVEYFNRDDIDRFTDFDREYVKMVALYELCNQFVHSYIFVPQIDEENKLLGCFVSSERNCSPDRIVVSSKRPKVYFVGLADIVSIFRRVGKDYPSQFTRFYDEKEQEWKSFVS
ncbi:hypothetical protein [Solidesulfovibrio magneticus]|uniref:hypothetical protein n=1 Tax=Solidesulfovibrio magneticus TaxID=184917 RepID=UPI0011D089A6|nr:hypothetical protein [Solidesulfovibrio magneticus]